MIRSICQGLLRLRGWKLIGERPDAPKVVVIAAPHTSNWDFVLMLMVGCAFGLRFSWMGKDAIFRGPFGIIMRWLGGIPVYRKSPRNLVEQMAEMFVASDQLVLAIPPEGTRGKADHWKSGFYHIARLADVPVTTSILDFKRKLGGFGPTITLTGDIVSDMDRIRAVYADVVGKRPSHQGPVRLREEAQPQVDPPVAG